MTDATATLHAPPPSPAPPLRRERRGGVVLLTLDRPAARNGLSLALLDALGAALREAGEDDATRCVVIAASGPVFCAGHDLREIDAHFADPDGGRDFFAEAMRRCAAVMASIPALPVPVIAAVEGMATAAGCQLVAACDLAVAGAGARFCTPGVAIGLFCSTPAVALSRAVGRKAAMRMLLTGEAIDADEALRIGLISHLAPAGDALDQALCLAEGIAARSAVAVRIGKRAFDAQHGAPLGDAYRVAAEAMTANLLAADAAEGIGAFLHKRAPHWSHR